MNEAQQKAAGAVSEAAADWVVRLSAPELAAADKTAFMAWLRQSPLHVAEYLSAELAFLAIENAARGDSTDVAGLLHHAKANIVDLPVKEASDAGLAQTRGGRVSAAEAKVEAAAIEKAATGMADIAESDIAESDIEELNAQPRRAAQTRRALWQRWPVSVITVAAASVLVAVGSIWILGREWRDPSTYSTGTGEQRRIVLADGSAIDLNTRSRVRVDFTPTSRDIYLTEGEAFFDVAKDPARPFRVKSGNAVVRAVGTQFNVYRQAAQTVVTVLEGRIAVSETISPGLQAIAMTDPGDASELAARPTPTLLTAGQKIIIAARGHAHAGMPQPVAVDAQAATAWQQRRLIIENWALADVVAEFNRYNRRQLVIDDAKLAGERISAVFDAGRPEDLLEFLVRNGVVRTSDPRESRIVLTRVR